MTKVWIVVESASGRSELPEADPILTRLLEVIHSSSGQAPDPALHFRPTVVTPAQLKPAPEDLICPLTVSVPLDKLRLGQPLYQQCRDLEALRQVVRQLGYASGIGDLWLPIVLTTRGPLYAEVIGKTNSASGHRTYHQPIHFTDELRQSLYHFSYRLLKRLSAPPSVYLVQFGVQDYTLYFDRLWPFPAQPAIASLGVQTPDLIECYWRCLTGQPILDLTILPEDTKLPAT